MREVTLYLCFTELFFVDWLKINFCKLVIQVLKSVYCSLYVSIKSNLLTVLFKSSIYLFSIYLIDLLFHEKYIQVSHQDCGFVNLYLYSINFSFIYFKVIFISIHTCYISE